MGNRPHAILMYGVQIIEPKDFYRNPPVDEDGNGYDYYCELLGERVKEPFYYQIGGSCEAPDEYEHFIGMEISRKHADWDGSVQLNRKDVCAGGDRLSNWDDQLETFCESQGYQIDGEPGWWLIADWG